MNIYRQSRSGDFIDVPLLRFAGIFDLGVLTVSYPAGAVIQAYQPRPGGSHPPIDLMFSFEGGHLVISCNQGQAGTADVFLVSEYHRDVRDELFLQSGKRHVGVAVQSDGVRVRVKGKDAETFIAFLGGLTFPEGAMIAASESARAGLYDIPSFGVQSVSATISRSGGLGRPFREPPSDPFRVMRRFCTKPAG